MSAAAARGKILFFENRVEMRENDVQARMGEHGERSRRYVDYVFLIFAGCLARIGHLELENEKCDMSQNHYFSNSINQKGKSVFTICTYIYITVCITYTYFVNSFRKIQFSILIFFFNEFS